jgi:hypothetical protein
LRDFIPKEAKKERAALGAHEAFTLNQLWDDRERDAHGRRRLP